MKSKNVSHKGIKDNLRKIRMKVNIMQKTSRRKKLGNTRKKCWKMFHGIRAVMKKGPSKIKSMSIFLERCLIKRIILGKISMKCKITYNSMIEKMKISSISIFTIWKRAIRSLAPNTRNIEIVGIRANKSKFKWRCLTL